MNQQAKVQPSPTNECQHTDTHYEAWWSDLSDEAVDVQVEVCACGMWYDEREGAWTIE